MIMETQKEWQVVFIICAVIFLIGGVFYCVFCDGQIQEWAKSKDPEEKRNKYEYDNEAITKF
ncbi:Vesicular glutamate transporter 1 [Brachionus plicatilis]|uniref:Vesicular glutamate transporter 1 n=1 Tax=Brachionus plicatilis TaxID=10195 RepID=A0A3M7PYA9_BRAPC|nr:Vesicular glutamate transporter 1 [Brachionus plicatilis]